MTNADQLIYVRIKRKEQTFCFLCDPMIETIGTIKERIAKIIFHQHPISNNNKYTINDLRIVSTTGIVPMSSSANTNKDLDMNTDPPNSNDEYTIYLDTDTLDYVQQEMIRSNKKNTNTSNTSSNTSSTTKNNDTTTNPGGNTSTNDVVVQNSNTGIILYLLLPKIIEQRSKTLNDDDDDDQDESQQEQQQQWETIHIVSTDI